MILGRDGVEGQPWVNPRIKTEVTASSFQLVGNSFSCTKILSKQQNPYFTTWVYGLFPGILIMEPVSGERNGWEMKYELGKVGNDEGKHSRNVKVCGV